MPGEGIGNLLQYYSCLGNPTDRGAWLLQSRGSQRVRHDLVNKHHIIRLVFHHWGNVLTIGCPLSKKKEKKAYLDLTKKYETIIFISSSNYEIMLEANTEKRKALLSRTWSPGRHEESRPGPTKI